MRIGRPKGGCYRGCGGGGRLHRCGGATHTHTSFETHMHRCGGATHTHILRVRTHLDLQWRQSGGVDDRARAFGPDRRPIGVQPAARLANVAAAALITLGDLGEAIDWEARHRHGWRILIPPRKRGYQCGLAHTAGAKDNAIVVLGRQELRLQHLPRHCAQTDAQPARPRGSAFNWSRGPCHRIKWAAWHKQGRDAPLTARLLATCVRMCGGCWRRVCA